LAGRQGVLFPGESGQARTPAGMVRLCFTKADDTISEKQIPLVMSENAPDVARQSLPGRAQVVKSGILGCSRARILIFME
jgi:hypothetical protein